MLQAQIGYFLDGYLWPRPNEKEALEDRYVPLALAFFVVVDISVLCIDSLQAYRPCTQYDY